MITQPYCFGPVIRQNWEVEMEQNCSLHGIKEAKGLPATLLYLEEIPVEVGKGTFRCEHLQAYIYVNWEK